MLFILSVFLPFFFFLFNNYLVKFLIIRIKYLYFKLLNYFMLLGYFHDAKVLLFYRIKLHN